MSGAWNEIRRRAQASHAAALAAAGGDVSARALVAAAARLTGIVCQGLPPDDVLLDGGEAALDIESGMIWYRNDVEPGLALYYQAHEFAHLWLDGGRSACRAGDLDGDSDGGGAAGVSMVESYGPRERREQRANIFAREFLLPVPAIRDWFGRGHDANAIASMTGLPRALVMHQMARALLLTEGAAPAESSEPRMAPELDPSQRAAAVADAGPVLVEAGPGTGKTRTLTARVVHLLASEAAPASILALTFSNRAAEEMRLRVAATAPAAAPDIWMGTFHAFGLELLRKYGSAVGLPPDVTVLDPTDALGVLEDALPELRLVHYQSLHEPAFQLRNILRAIARAKDEHAGPARYAGLADAMGARAVTPDDRERAEKALEVAHAYAVYQQRLAAMGAVDFGDLIGRSIDVLRSSPDVAREVQARFRHVLVDEYQDVNRASALLLAALAGDGRGLWVVGDARQAIYRFRGAAPTNMARFAQDFPGARTLTLDANYRSQPAIVGALSTVAPKLRASNGRTDFVGWTPQRADAGGRVDFEVASDLEAECLGIADAIRRHRALGVAYREQAVLCRSHSQLARVAARIEAAGIPVLYLGDVFERPEVRDLLSVVALVCERDDSALHRVARLPGYDAPMDDVTTLVALAREREVRLPAALALAATAPGLSECGRDAFARLARDLDDFHFGTTAWGVLTEYLFARSTYLRAAPKGGALEAQQRGLAIHQLLQFAHDARRLRRQPREDAKRRFLDHIRRLELLDDEKALRRLPEDAEAIDAVRLMTVHASKGLEFRVVYLPMLGPRYFPLNRPPQPCPPPDGLLGEGAADAHAEEEECLFFVGLSRARDGLCLSRAQRYGATNSKPSPLLSLVAERLPRAPASAPTWTQTRPAAVADEGARPRTAARPDAHEARALDDYLDCPRYYYYERVLVVGRGRAAPPHVRLRRSVMAVVPWARDRLAAGEGVDVGGAVGRLGEAMQERELNAHPFAAYYRQAAESMVRRLVDVASTVRELVPPDTREVELAQGRVVVAPEFVEALPDGSERVTRFRVGRVDRGDGDQPIVGLLVHAHAAGQALRKRTVRLVSLTSDTTLDVGPDSAAVVKSLAIYDEAIAGIASGRFPATPRDRRCAGCAHYFTCPA